MSNKIPAYVGMTAFLVFRAAVGALQRFQPKKCPNPACPENILQTLADYFANQPA